MFPSLKRLLILCVAILACHATEVRAQSVRLLDSIAIQSQFQAMSRRLAAADDPSRTARWSEFCLLAGAVIGQSMDELSFEDVAAGASGARGPVIRPTSGFAGRDRLAYQMLSVGYSPQEISDVLTGRITLRALDVAKNMIAGGLGRERAADYLDRQYKRLVRVPAPAPPAPPQKNDFRANAFDGVIEEQARRYSVSAQVVRAIIEAESGFNPAARSSGGAIGLMQLMPATAKALGVNPLVPEQNIEGGVRYFSQLLKTFGGVELALVAYNAGPGFAQRYARGQAVLYGETRDYVRRVLDRLQASR